MFGHHCTVGRERNCCYNGACSFASERPANGTNALEEPCRPATRNVNVVIGLFDGEQLSEEFSADRFSGHLITSVTRHSKGQLAQQHVLLIYNVVSRTWLQHHSINSNLRVKN